MEIAITTQPPNIPARTTLTDTDLDIVAGGARRNFQYEKANGSTYAIGHINGRTVSVRVG